MDRPRLAGVAAEQAGVFTRAQARAAGWSSGQVRRRVARGEWRVVLGAGLTGRPGPDPGTTRAWAAALTCPAAIVSHHTAGLLWGLDLPVDDLLHVTDRAPARRRTGLVVHTRAVADDDIEVLIGLAVTSASATVVDCASVLTYEQGLRLVTSAYRTRLLTPAEFVRRVHAAAGRHGAPRLARLARACASDAWSVAEVVAHDVLRRGGVTGWAANVPLHDERGLIGIVDLLFERERLVVEIDGRAFHGAAQQQHDRERQNRIVCAGYRILRFSLADLLHRPGHVLALVRAELAAVA
jgi:hypothetical protein